MQSNHYPQAVTTDSTLDGWFGGGKKKQKKDTREKDLKKAKKQVKKQGEKTTRQLDKQITALPDPHEAVVALKQFEPVVRKYSPVIVTMGLLGVAFLLLRK